MTDRIVSRGTVPTPEMFVFPRFNLAEALRLAGEEGDAVAFLNFINSRIARGKVDGWSEATSDYARTFAGADPLVVIDLQIARLTAWLMRIERTEYETFSQLVEAIGGFEADANKVKSLCLKRDMLPGFHDDIVGFAMTSELMLKGMLLLMKSTLPGAGLDMTELTTDFEPFIGMIYQMMNEPETHPNIVRVRVVLDEVVAIINAKATPAS